MLLKLVHIPKYRGGRNKDANAFYTTCEKHGATITIDETFQSDDQSIDGFSHVGKTQGDSIVVKVMPIGFRALNEIATATYFRKHPHRNIVQGFCEFECKTDPVKWEKSVKTPQQVCSKGVSVTVILQEYIQNGSFDKFFENMKRLPKKVWIPLTLQLVYAVVEFSSFGFFHNDLHFGNILIDTTDDSTCTYTVLGETKTVYLKGVVPVLTDFSHATFKEQTSFSDIAIQISIIIDIMTNKAPLAFVKPLQSLMNIAYIAKTEEHVKDVIHKLEEVVKK
jgi:serine/threonine protein kinase